GARTQLAVAEGLLIVAQSERDRARIDLARALGIDPATPIQLADTLGPSLGAVDVSVQRDSAVARAVATRPDLVSEAARGVAARRTGSAIAAERLPRMSGGGDDGGKGLRVARALQRGPGARGARTGLRRTPHAPLALTQSSSTRQESSTMPTITQPEAPISAAARRTPVEPRSGGGGRRGFAFAVMGAALVGLLAVGARHWWFNRSHVSTDDAQVDGHIIPILPTVGGFVTTVRVDENKPVKLGDTLVVLDERDYRARLA